MSKVIIIWAFGDPTPIGMRTMVEDVVGIPIAILVTRRILPSRSTPLCKDRCYLTNRRRRIKFTRSTGVRRIIADVGQNVQK
jgi:hypothetical protein